MTEANERLVVVSNRVGPVRDAARAGGLAVAIVDTIRNTGGLWFGWSGEVKDIGPVKVEEHGRIKVATLDLSEIEYEQYYQGFSNATLWPLFHYRLDLATFRRTNYLGYRAVNERFADHLAPILHATDRVWVHDFHLLPLGEELRNRGCRQSLGYFLHVPFPAPEILTVLPMHRELVESLFAYDLIGFQSDIDLRCFLNYVRYELGGTVDSHSNVFALGKTVRAEVFPIGIDTEGFRGFVAAKEAESARKRILGALAKRQAVVGVDRLDYSKGLPERFRAWQRFLRDNPEQRGRVSYVQIAPPSRIDVVQYQQIRHELEALSGSINGEYAEFDWTPLRYINRSYSRRALAGIYNISAVGLVTPLRDGMNLVAKEYVAAQPEEDPGVLILSRFAGAARDADGAIIVNPYDTQGVADALKHALAMPRGERQARWESLKSWCDDSDVAIWRQRFLACLDDCGTHERSVALGQT